MRIVLAYLQSCRWQTGAPFWHPVFVPILVTVAVALILAGVAGYLSIRFAGQRSDNTIVMGLFMLAAVFGIVAIFALTFFRKTLSS